MKILSLISAILLIQGCSSLSSPTDLSRINVEPQRSWYYAGDTVAVDVKNNTGTAISLSFCPYLLERWNDLEQTWELVDQNRPPNEGCTAVAHGLRNKYSLTWKGTLPADILPGIYRWKLPAPWVGNPEFPDLDMMSSDPFEVRDRSVAY